MSKLSRGAKVIVGGALTDVGLPVANSVKAFASRRTANEHDVCAVPIVSLAETPALVQANEIHRAFVGLVQDLWRDLDGGHRADYTPHSPPSANRNRGEWLRLAPMGGVVIHSQTILALGPPKTETDYVRRRDSLVQ